MCRTETDNLNNKMFYVSGQWNAIKQFVYVKFYKRQPTFRQTAIVNNNAAVLAQTDSAMTQCHVASFPGFPLFIFRSGILARGTPGKTYHVIDVTGRKEVERT